MNDFSIKARDYAMAYQHSRGMGVKEIAKEWHVSEWVVERSLERARDMRGDKQCSPS